MNTFIYNQIPKLEFYYLYITELCNNDFVLFCKMNMLKFQILIKSNNFIVFLYNLKICYENDSFYIFNILSILESKKLGKINSNFIRKKFEFRINRDFFKKLIYLIIY